MYKIVLLNTVLLPFQIQFTELFYGWVVVGVGRVWKVIFKSNQTPVKKDLRLCWG